jgi:hypothetical protein
MIPLDEREKKLDLERAKARERYAKRREYFKEYHKKNRERRLTYCRQYRKGHLAEAAEYARAYRAEHGAKPRFRIRTAASQKAARPPPEPLPLETLKSKFMAWRKQREEAA